MKLFSNKPDQQHRDAFDVFYSSYAPGLWGIILTANLPSSVAEAILVSTLSKAWQKLREPGSTDACSFRWLLSIAYQQGLPPDILKKFLLGLSRAGLSS